MKSEDAPEDTPEVESLPSRERGLKLLRSAHLFPCAKVAPFAGAWIEIEEEKAVKIEWVTSLPSRERGLKLLS